jgi:hypothetical protein
LLALVDDEDFEWLSTSLSSVVSFICSNVLSFVSPTVRQTKGERDRCGERGNSPQPFLPQLSRVNRFAPRGLSQYADDIQQFSFFFATT